MGLNPRCPKCGSAKVQLTTERHGHGCLWTLLFGIYYICWRLIKWVIGICLFIIYDWWMAIIHACLGKSHKWACKNWFTNTRRTYYCHDCGYNFKF